MKHIARFNINTPFSNTKDHQKGEKKRGIRFPCEKVKIAIVGL
jgi:hypothetical protein